MRNLSGSNGNVSLGAILLDPQTEVEFVNDTALKLLGCTGKDELTRRWEEVMPTPNLSRQYLSKVRNPFRCKAELHIQEQLRRLELEIDGLDPEASQGHLILLRDRHVIDRLECELLLASQGRALPYLMSGLVHALADPLNAMQITLELLRVTREDDMKSQAGKDFTERWQHGITVLDTELARFKRHLQILRGQRERSDSSDPKDIDLCTVIDEVIGMLQHHAQVRRIQLQNHPPVAVTMIKGRYDHIQQALLILVIHMLETMADGGQLRVEISPANGQAEVVLQDDGPGITADVLDDIDQIHAIMTKSLGGLPLYLARRVAEAHGGDLLIETGMGKGTCFRLRLPCLHPTPATPESQ